MLLTQQHNKSIDIYIFYLFVVNVVGFSHYLIFLLLLSPSLSINTQGKVFSPFPLDQVFSLQHFPRAVTGQGIEDVNKNVAGF